LGELGEWVEPQRGKQFLNVFTVHGAYISHPSFCPMVNRASI
jgi:hypothetical protein